MPPVFESLRRVFYRLHILIPLIRQFLYFLILITFFTAFLPLANTYKSFFFCSKELLYLSAAFRRNIYILIPGMFVPTVFFQIVPICLPPFIRSVLLPLSCDILIAFVVDVNIPLRCIHFFSDIFPGADRYFQISSQLLASGRKMVLFPVDLSTVISLRPRLLQCPDHGRSGIQCPQLLQFTFSHLPASLLRHNTHPAGSLSRLP